MHILNVSFLTVLINFGVLLCKSVLHLLRFSVFIYTGTVTDTARRLCSLQGFGTISSFSYKIASLNSRPSFLLQANIVSLRTVPLLVKLSFQPSFCKKKKNQTVFFEKKNTLLVSFGSKTRFSQPWLLK